MTNRNSSLVPGSRREFPKRKQERFENWVKKNVPVINKMKLLSPSLNPRRIATLRPWPQLAQNCTEGQKVEVYYYRQTIMRERQQRAEHGKTWEQMICEEHFNNSFGSICERLLRMSWNIPEWQ